MQDKREIGIGDTGISSDAGGVFAAAEDGRDLLVMPESLVFDGLARARRRR